MRAGLYAAVALVGLSLLVLGGRMYQTADDDRVRKMQLKLDALQDDVDRLTILHRVELNNSATAISARTRKTSSKADTHQPSLPPSLPPTAPPTVSSARRSPVPASLFFTMACAEGFPRMPAALLLAADAFSKRRRGLVQLAWQSSRVALVPNDAFGAE